jgi:hypothetical protein
LRKKCRRADIFAFRTEEDFVIESVSRFGKLKHA